MIWRFRHAVLASIFVSQSHRPQTATLGGYAPTPSYKDPKTSTLLYLQESYSLPELSSLASGERERCVAHELLGSNFRQNPNGPECFLSCEDADGKLIMMVVLR